MNAFRGPLVWCLILLPAAAVRSDEAGKVILVIHGGAGVRPKKEMTPELRGRYKAELRRALQAGFDALKGGTSLDAVETSIRVLEDSQLFNAGKGAVFTNEGRNELDASIMEGENRNAGAVAGVTRIKNPIAAARAVMEKSQHVLLVGRGAEQFVADHRADYRIEFVHPHYFFTQERYDALLEAQKAEKKQPKGKGELPRPRDRYFGTVGAVALKDGTLAAGTSTGGMTNKRFGRVGDSPIISAGTYADNATCGVSCTGHGEVFIRHAVAYDVSARMKYRGLSVARAARETIDGLPDEEDGVGGLIALDAKGNVAMAYSARTEGMYRGYVTADGTIKVLIYED